MENEKGLMNLDGLSEEMREEIIKDGQAYASPRVPIAPTIGISLDDDTIGRFYIDQGEEAGGKVMLDKELDVIILKEKKTFSYYNKGTDSLELFSNELDVSNGKVSYQHPVVLKNNNGDVVFSGTYEQFVEAKKTTWLNPVAGPSGYIGSLLKQKTLLYVAIPVLGNKIARLFVNLSSTVGLDPNGGYLFKDPAPDSLESLRAKKTSIAPYTYIVRISNVKGAGQIVWRQLKFSYLKDVDSTEVVKMFNLKREVEQYCDAMSSLFGINMNAAHTPKQSTPALEGAQPSPADELPTIQVEDEPIDFGEPDNEKGFDPSLIQF